MSADTVKTWSALLISEDNGLLGVFSKTWDGHPECYERSMLVRKSDLDQAIRDRDDARTTCQEIDKSHRILESEVKSLRTRVAELEQWKQEQLKVETEWDPQAVAKLLEIGLGQSIRANIQPKIEALLNRITELESVNNTLHSLVKTGERRGIEKATEEFSQKIAELEESNRLLKEQIRVADAAFNFQMEQKHDLEMQLHKERCDNITTRGEMGELGAANSQLHARVDELENHCGNLIHACYVSGTTGTDIEDAKECLKKGGRK